MGWVNHLMQNFGHPHDVMGMGCGYAAHPQAKITPMRALLINVGYSIRGQM